MQIILASASPRRRELLAQIGLEFTVIPSKGEEVITKKIPHEVVMELSQQKAREIAAGAGKGSLIIGADTIVVYREEIMGKPKDVQDAVRMITELAGHTHEVYTGVTIIDEAGAENTFYECTKVHMYPASTEEIAAYVATGEPMDKAGAYAIQGYGSRFISGIEGDYHNVVGLPVGRLYQEIRHKLIEK